MTYVEVGAVDILQGNSNGMFAWLIIIYVADTMRCQIDMTILIFRDLVFSTKA
jgi:hypothetical protein